MMKKTATLLILTVALVGGAGEARAQLSNAWIVPAAAHVAGVGGTFWRTDLSIHNPQEVELPVVVQALESDRDNSRVPTMDLVLRPWETLNLWDVFGPDEFDLPASGALLVYVPTSQSCSGIDCDVLVTSRTYTVDPAGGVGEYGQAVNGATLLEGTDWATFAYVAGVLNDGQAFRCNVGVASWTPDWTRVQVDVQDADGTIVASETFDVPPFGHHQQRLRTPVVGGSLVFFLVDGPEDSWVYPYASMVDQDTGDPAYFFAKYSGVGVAAKRSTRTPESVPARGRAVHPRAAADGAGRAREGR
jgi:hypothetical protein